MNSLTLKTVLSVVSIGVALLIGGCGNAAQKRAYEQAAKKEQPVSSETAPAIIASYKQVISMDPGSKWAKKAQARIAAVQAQVKAENMRKDVFHEHGID